MRSTIRNLRDTVVNLTWQDAVAAALAIGGGGIGLAVAVQYARGEVTTPALTATSDEVPLK